jgi:hypothetical protein
MAICLISSSGIGPGPLGILPTNPIAEAPNWIAVFASSILLMQHILILGFIYQGVSGAFELTAKRYGNIMCPGLFILLTGLQQ